jgi:[acyl-carrier-protein] S-malonyltransferase
MNKIGLLFPGQGSQYAGMGKDLYNKFSAAKKIMDDANEILEFDIRRMIFDGTNEDILPTQIAQPAIFIVSAMYFEKFKQMEKSFDVVAGHSLGEYTALYAAGVLSFEDCLRLVRKRGLAMGKQNSLGTMFAVMGVDIEKIKKYLEGLEQKVVIANINSKTQIVISGYIDEIKKVSEELSQIEGSKVKQLNVSGAFHSPLMKEVKEIMSKEIDSVNFREPESAIIPNVLGYATRELITIRESLKEQITEKVRWLDTIMHIKSMGIEQLYEIGPGEVLSKLNKTITFRPKCNIL